MSKLKIVLLVTGALIVGIIIGASGGNSSTTGKVTSNSKEVVQQSTVKSESSSSPQVDATSGKVEVKSQTKRIDAIGYTDVVGEVVNKTQNDVRSVEVIATFYNTEGKVIATNQTYAHSVTDTTPLLAGATAPFEVSSSNKVDAASFKLDVTWH